MAMADDDVRIDGHRVIGTYSTSGEVDYINDDRNRRFYLDPGNAFDFNYGKAFGNFTERRGRSNSEQARVGGRYKWMRDHRQVLIDNGILDTDKSRLNVDFVTHSGLISCMLQMGGKKDLDMGLAVTLYKGTYHLRATQGVSTGRGRAERQDDALLKASSRLLLNFVTSRDGQNTDEPAPVIDNETFCTMMRVNCGRHPLLVLFEIQAEKRITPNEPPPELPNPRNCLNVRSREKHQYINPMRALAWWAPNVIAGIPEICCGLRDDERRTIERIETIETDRLATSRYTKNRWDPGDCFRTMESLLSQIKDLVPEDDPNSFKQAVLIINPVEEGPGVNRTFEIREPLEEDRFVREHEIRCIFEGNE